jgi:hypothetical protein
MNSLHAGPQRQERYASLRDDLRPHLTPGTGEHLGGLSDRRLVLAGQIAARRLRA